MFSLLETRTSGQMLSEVLEHETREQARLMAEYDPAEEIADDPMAWQDPAEWPSWTDADCWVPTEEPPYEPTPEEREWLAPLDIARKIFIHVNNSNPALREDSHERAAVEAAGWEVSYDGMEVKV